MPKHVHTRHCFLLSTAAILLSACASRPQPAAASAPPAAAPAVSVGVGQGHRFHMTQNGRRMSADDFDAWMKARGVRVARGPAVANSAAPRAAAATQPPGKRKPAAGKGR